jgi:hypothetical protein
MVPLKYEFAALAMISTFVTTALPALAQTSAEQQLVQGIAMVGMIAESGILGMLFLIALMATIRSLMPPPDEEPKYPWSTFALVLMLGLAAAMIALIIGRWTDLLKSDILISLLLATSLMVGTYIGKRIYKKNLQELEDLLRVKYIAFMENERS